MRIIIAAMLMLLVSQVHAYGTSHQLVRDCTVSPTTPDEAFRRMHCTGYISGVLDGYAVVSGLYQNVRVHCAPALNAEQVLTVLADWLRQSHDRSATPARSGILLALRDRYPCR